MTSFGTVCNLEQTEIVFPANFLLIYFPHIV